MKSTARHPDTPIRTARLEHWRHQMQVRTWSNRDCHPGGDQHGAATLEDSVAVSYKRIIRLPRAPGVVPQELCPMAFTQRG